MGRRNKKRKVKITVFLTAEGERELRFFEVLKELFCDPLVHITCDQNLGGNSTYRLNKGISQKNNYDRVYALFDEDIPLRKNLGV